MAAARASNRRRLLLLFFLEKLLQEIRVRPAFRGSAHNLRQLGNRFIKAALLMEYICETAPRSEVKRIAGDDLSVLLDLLVVQGLNSPPLL